MKEVRVVGTGYVASSHVSPFSRRLNTRLFFKLACNSNNPNSQYHFIVVELVQSFLLLFLRIDLGETTLELQRKQRHWGDVRSLHFWLFRGHQFGFRNDCYSSITKASHYGQNTPQNPWFSQYRPTDEDCRSKQLPPSSRPVSLPMEWGACRFRQRSPSANRRHHPCSRICAPSRGKE